MTTVLFVEDDVDLRDELSEYLAASGYLVKGVSSVEQAEMALTESFDLLVLDINLPDGSGFELCARMRPYIRSGIVMCTGRSEQELRIRSLKDGADAYLVKPVDPEELEATLVSVYRRLSGAGVSMLQRAPLPVQWRLDYVRQTLTGPNSDVIKLSKSESQLLYCFFAEPSRKLSRFKLLDSLKENGFPTNERRLEALISRLRGKVLEHMGLNLPLDAVYGQGYIFLDHAIVF